MVRLLPSLLAADFANLERDIKKIENYADGLHLDIMDGQFVPNISFGIPVLKSLREITNMHFDTHLMIINPENYIENFAEFSNAITVHYEASTHLHRIVNQIKEKGCQAGVSLNPHTPVSVLEEILPELDKVLIMSVNPGFTGQKFIPSILLKVKKLKEMSEKLNPNLEIIVDEIGRAHV